MRRNHAQAGLPEMVQPRTNLNKVTGSFYPAINARLRRSASFSFQPA
jgi:hypothetical protein